MVTTSTKDDSVEHEESKPKERNNEGLDLPVSWSLLPSLWRDTLIKSPPLISLISVN